MTVTLDGVSLFAGVGGFDLGMKAAGITPRVAVEIDDKARGVLADRFPALTLFSDVRTVTADDLYSLGLRPAGTVLCGGFPCQDLSVAGRRRGMGEGTRSGLFFEIVRLLADFPAEWVVLENVPGLLSAVCPCLGDQACDSADCPGELHNIPGGVCPGGCIAAHGGAMGAVLGELGRLGYGYAYRVLDAQHFGVPQRRRRVFIVARRSRDAWASPVEVLLEPEGCAGHPASGEPAGQAAARAIVVGTLTAGGGERGYRVGADEAAEGQLVVGEAKHAEFVEQAAAQTLRAAGGSCGGGSENLAVTTWVKSTRPATDQHPEVWTPDDTAPTLNVMDNGGDTRATVLAVTPLAVRGRDGGAQLEAGEPGDPMHTLRAGDGGSSRSPLVQITHTLTGEGHDASEDGTGRGVPLVAQTLTAGSHAPNVSAPGRRQEDDYNLAVAESTVRRLTPTECERLQGFPDGWTVTSNGKEQADSHRYKQMGNAVAVPVVAWIMRRLVAAGVPA